MEKSVENKGKKDGLKGYLKYGTSGAGISSIPGLIIAGLKTMGPEYVRAMKPEHLAPAAVLAGIGFAVGCGIKYIRNRRS